MSSSGYASFANHSRRRDPIKSSSTHSHSYIINAVLSQKPLRTNVRDRRACSCQSSAKWPSVSDGLRGRCYLTRLVTIMLTDESSLTSVLRPSFSFSPHFPSFVNYPKNGYPSVTELPSVPPLHIYTDCIETLWCLKCADIKVIGLILFMPIFSPQCYVLFWYI